MLSPPLIVKATMDAFYTSFQRMVVAFSMFTKIGCLRISVHLTQYIFDSCFKLSIKQELGGRDRPSRVNKFKLRHYLISTCECPSKTASVRGHLRPLETSRRALGKM